jgi:hypothetical protein
VKKNKKYLQTGNEKYINRKGSGGGGEFVERLALVEDKLQVSLVRDADVKKEKL